MTLPMTDAVFECKDGIARFTMNRPDLLNALTEDIKNDFASMLDYVEGNAEVGALVLAGAGRAFSAGGNVKNMQSTGEEPTVFRNRVRTMHTWMQRLFELDCPVIAEVDGLAYGGGFALATAADFVMASPKARFCAVFGRIGLIPDMALLYTLPRAVGNQRAKELMYTARSFDAAEAKALGLVLSVHDSAALGQAVDAFAARLAQGSRQAIGLTKQLINRSHASDYATMAELEANGQSMMHETPFHAEAVRRFV
ncbi:MAG: enoyl-CoA hydratase/isomerase family protein, partial [Chromatiales bacterium]|nr:enoyl-CoA hydratase/isomerase family protein [Chromatiales bacterium]